jgi:hypothetical protein
LHFLWLSIDCWSSFGRFFYFSFSPVTKHVCVVNALIKGEIESLCGSRTGGWSLSGVMSDWQCGVDWLLAKYCRCKLLLDWCRCRWRTSANGPCEWVSRCGADK